jgi:hypothetical protein
MKAQPTGVGPYCVPVHTSPATRWRTRLVAMVIGSSLLVAPACSLRHHTIKARAGTLTVTPPSGKVGTKFSLAAGGFLAGEPMTFEIDIPKSPKFVGPSHTAGLDGTVTSAYTPLTGDPPGVYVVKAVGSRGTRAEGRLTVVAG